MGQPLDPRVAIGHMRLRVADLERAAAFYAGVLGFDEFRRDGSRLILGVGGHQHIVLSTSDGSSADPALPSHRFAIRYPDRASFDDALQRLASADLAAEPLDQDEGGAVMVSDADGHQIELYWLRSSSEQASASAAQQALLGDTGRQRLGELRARLLDLHKVLLDDTRAAYEMDRGRVGSNANLLQLVINDPWFAWLRAISELVVRIDQIIEDPKASSTDATAIVAQVERLLTASETGEGFARRYFDALQRQPAVVLAHADVRRTIKSMR